MTVIDDIDFNEPQSAVAKSSTSPPPIMTVTAPPPSKTNTDVSVWKEVGGWTVYVDHTLDDGCFLFGSFTNNTSFRVGVNRDAGGHYYVMLANPDWRSLQVDQKYPVQFKFGSNSPWDVPATAKDMGGSTIALMANFTDPTFWSEFSTSPELDVTRDGKPVTRIELAGSKAAFDELVSCQKSEDAQARARDPFAQ